MNMFMLILGNIGLCCEIMLIFIFSMQGYQGMVDGGDNIEEASWESVSSMLQVVSSAINAFRQNTMDLFNIITVTGYIYSIRSG